MGEVVANVAVKREKQHEAILMKCLSVRFGSIFDPDVTTYKLLFSLDVGDWRIRLSECIMNVTRLGRFFQSCGKD